MIDKKYFKLEVVKMLYSNSELVASDMAKDGFRFCQHYNYYKCNKKGLTTSMNVDSGDVEIKLLFTDEKEKHFKQVVIQLPEKAKGFTHHGYINRDLVKQVICNFFDGYNLRTNNSERLLIDRVCNSLAELGVDVSTGRSSYNREEVQREKADKARAIKEKLEYKKLCDLSRFERLLPNNQLAGRAFEGLSIEAASDSLSFGMVFKFSLGHVETIAISADNFLNHHKNGFEIKGRDKLLRLLESAFVGTKLEGDSEKIKDILTNAENKIGNKTLLIEYNKVLSLDSETKEIGVVGSDKKGDDRDKYREWGEDNILKNGGGRGGIINRITNRIHRDYFGGHER